MSCVIGLVNKTGVWLGADGIGTTEDGQRRPGILNKIIRNGLYLIGFAGSIRGGQLTNPYYFKPPRNILDFPNFLIDLFQKSGCLEKTSEGASIHSCNFIIGYKKKLYEILADFQLNEISEYSAIGSGAPFAYGSLYETSSTNLKPEERLIRALKAAESFDRATGEPFEVHKL